MLARAGRTLDAIDVVEINEAFAWIVLAWKRELGIPSAWFEEHVHPSGATDRRLYIPSFQTQYCG